MSSSSDTLADPAPNGAVGLGIKTQQDPTAVVYPGEQPPSPVAAAGDEAVLRKQTSMPNMGSYAVPVVARPSSPQARPASPITFEYEKLAKSYSRPVSPYGGDVDRPVSPVEMTLATASSLVGGSVHPKPYVKPQFDSLVAKMVQQTDASGRVVTRAVSPSPGSAAAGGLTIKTDVRATSPVSMMSDGQPQDRPLSPYGLSASGFTLPRNQAASPAPVAYASDKALPSRPVYVEKQRAGGLRNFWRNLTKKQLLLVPDKTPAPAMASTVLEARAQGASLNTQAAAAAAAATTTRPYTPLLQPTSPTAASPTRAMSASPYSQYASPASPRPMSPVVGNAPTSAQPTMVDYMERHIAELTAMLANLSAKPESHIEAVRCRQALEIAKGIVAGWRD
ncbi:hypothetical protein DFJ74DRAFT_673027 [Hyaloraphidium curvatum]|nr:hypothetical protein DFJ74DRAFT_673027 [Hyaloraphidium curvatum]